MTSTLACYQPYAKLPIQAFLERVPQSIFLLEEAGGMSDMTGTYTLSISSGALELSEPEVLVLAKKIPATNPMRSLVTLGRSASNDLEVKSEGVSKYHCFFKEQERGGWVVLDARSRNGTWVNQRRLGPADKHVLRDEDRVRLGLSVVLTYYSPRALYRRLQEEALRCA